MVHQFARQLVLGGALAGNGVYLYRDVMSLIGRIGPSPYAVRDYLFFFSAVASWRRP